MPRPKRYIPFSEMPSCGAGLLLSILECIQSRPAACNALVDRFLSFFLFVMCLFASEHSGVPRVVVRCTVLSSFGQRAEESTERQGREVAHLCPSSALFSPLPLQTLFGSLPFFRYMRQLVRTAHEASPPLKVLIYFHAFISGERGAPQKYPLDRVLNYEGPSGPAPVIPRLGLCGDAHS